MKQGYSLTDMEDRIGYHFKDIALLKQALTHSSFTNEQKINKAKNYERLEFLGDAVLELVSSDFLFRLHPNMPEGKLTKLRASMVCEPSLAFCARDLELGRFMLLGKGEEMTGGRERDSIISDVMEAVIGAVYLDGGMTPAKDFINRFILSDLEDKKLFYDSKSSLQELVQGSLKKNVSYELLEESGPEHDKTFRVSVYMEGKPSREEEHSMEGKPSREEGHSMEGKPSMEESHSKEEGPSNEDKPFIKKECLGTGTGRTKKAAEQQAAYKALLFLRDNKCI